MREVLPEEQSLPEMPSGVVRLRIDRKTGRRVTGMPEGSVYEYFFEEFLPAQTSDGDKPVGTDELEGLF